MVLLGIAPIIVWDIGNHAYPLASQGLPHGGHQLGNIEWFVKKVLHAPLLSHLALHLGATHRGEGNNRDIGRGTLAPATWT